MVENGVHDSFLWENHEWAFLNSDDSGCGSDEKSGKKVSDSNASNSQSRPPPEVDATRLAGGKRVASLGDNGDGGDQGNKEKGGDNGREPTNHEGYLWTERERRKKIRNMFATLQDLLPQLPPKVDQSTVLDEAVKHIKILQNTLNHLKNQKLEREAVLAPRFPIVFKTWTSPNIALNVCGYDAHINICCSMKPGLLANICCVLEKYKIEVISAHVSSDHNRSMYMIHARVTDGYVCQFLAEEIYKQAAEEIIILCG